MTLGVRGAIASMGEVRGGVRMMLTIFGGLKKQCSGGPSACFLFSFALGCEMEAGTLARPETG